MREIADRFFRLLGMYSWEELNPGKGKADHFWRQSRPGTFRRYFSLDGDLFYLVIELGPIAITWEKDYA